jgi:hypothetical protein
MSQEDLLATVPNMKDVAPLTQERLSDAEARLYQVSLADVEALTDLDFGSLSSADTKAHEVAGVPGPRPIKGLQDIRLG